MDKPTILFDHRDNQRDGTHPWADQAREYLSVKANIEVGFLDLGDISWQGKGRPHLVEMKNAKDFVDSLTRGHLQDQIARMLRWRDEENGGVATIHLIIAGMIGKDKRGFVTYCVEDWLQPDFDREGGSSFRRMGMPQDVINVPGSAGSSLVLSQTIEWIPGYRPYNMFSNYLVSLQEMGVGVYWVAPNFFGTMFMGLYNHSIKRSHSIPSRRAVSVLSPEQQGLMSLSPSLRVSGAKSLLEYFGSFHDVIIQPVDSLLQVGGVGKISAKEIYKAARRVRSQVG